jgi:hypothetical protein
VGVVEIEMREVAAGEIHLLAAQAFANGRTRHGIANGGASQGGMQIGGKLHDKGTARRTVADLRCGSEWAFRKRFYGHAERARFTAECLIDHDQSTKIIVFGIWLGPIACLA